MVLCSSAASVYMFIVNLVCNGGGQEYKCMIDVMKLYRCNISESKHDFFIRVFCIMKCDEVKGYCFYLLLG